MASDRYDAITRLVRERQPACGSTKVIAVDGPSGSGKTSFVGGLVTVVDARVLHLDDVYPGWHGLAATPPLIARALEDLSVGSVGSVPRWSWVRNEPAPPLRLTPAPLLIVDGVGSGAAAIRPFLSLLIWVEAALDVRKERALARDGGTYAPFWDTWAAQEARHFGTDQTRPRADLIIRT